MFFSGRALSASICVVLDTYRLIFSALVTGGLWMHRLKQLREGSEMQHQMRFGVGWGIWKRNTT